MSEWLRRQTRNLLGFACAGSNPAVDGKGKGKGRGVDPPSQTLPFWSKHHTNQTQMMSGNPNLWDMYVHHPPYYHHHQPPPPPQAPPPPPPPTSASPLFFQPQFVFGSSSLPLPPPHNPLWFSSDDNPLYHEQLPHSWSQLLLGGLPSDEVGHFQMRKLGDCWDSEQEEEMGVPTRGASAVDLKKEAAPPKIVPTPSWTHMVIPASSPTSCVTSLSGGNAWDFSKNAKEGVKNLNSGHSSECNSTTTGGACKKARVHPPSTQPPLMVRKEKLGDRITALHQLVSPFGKTDTASVLLEAIGYIRFLQGQIEALSSPYFRGSEDGSGNTRSSSQLAVSGEAEKYAGLISGDTVQPTDLRSRGLCLVPVSCTAQVGNDNGADYWAPAFGGGF
ncbi:hypothetical protein MLD38_030715 [Melastoma candidum]|uniref:Uncharacterized protein n=1 Tax=Melastoma candidum TaxID=119954 RepID=A0ACB9MLZ1_9MYRT|nr:hypothetical protein MLD38_030715 [Melastoma candidum]